MYTIGQFSKIVRISTKALRFYDEIGLLKPVHVDQVNGYRYYSPEQVWEVIFINELKEYGFSLEEMKELIAIKEPDLLAKALNEKIDELERNLSKIFQTREMLKSRIKILQEGGRLMDMSLNYKVEIKEKEPHTVAYVRRTIPLAEIGILCDELAQKIEQAKVQVSGYFMAIYYDEDFNPESADIELCVPVVKNDSLSLNFREMAGGTHASITHVGSYDKLGSIYAVLSNWIRQNGYTVIRAPFDLYLVGPESTDDEQKYVTEVCFPVAKK